jgi:NAD(P)-dependent dehydrogenase (short-subunit alcohol dehydrogenase family)
MTSWSAAAGLEGRGIIVTGAAGGIGRAVAAAFAGAGARVLATDLHQGSLDDLIAGLSGAGHVALAEDVRDEGAQRRLVARAVAEFGGLYGLINMAAVSRRRYALADVTTEDWDTQHDVNLKAVFFLSRAASAAMIDGGAGGRIVTFASVAWWTGGLAGSMVYAASKGGVVSLMRGLARTLGPHGITVNSIAPGFVNTPMLTDVGPDMLASMVAKVPLGRLAEPDDIAGVTVFLASDHARYITGATIDVSGGFLMY